MSWTTNISANTGQSVVRSYLLFNYFPAGWCFIGFIDGFFLPVNILSRVFCFADEFFFFFFARHFFRAGYMFCRRIFFCPAQNNEQQRQNIIKVTALLRTTVRWCQPTVGNWRPASWLLFLYCKELVCDQWTWIRGQRKNGNILRFSCYRQLSNL